MRIINILLIVSLCCLVGAKYLPDGDGSRALLRNVRSTRYNLEHASDSQSNESDDDDADDNDNDDNNSLERKKQKEIQRIERKRNEEERKLQEKREKEERKRNEQLEKEQRKKEKIEAKYEEEKQKLEEKLRKEEQKRKEKIEKEERKRIEKLAEADRKHQEKLAKEERKKQENINKKLEVLEQETVKLASKPSDSVESEEDLDFEDIWKNYIYEKYGLTQISTDLERNAAVNKYLLEELGLNANSTKSEYRQAVLHLVQNQLVVQKSPSSSQSGFGNYLTSHLNAAYIQKLQTEIEGKIAELDTDTDLLNNVSLPWVPEAKYAIEQKRTILTSIAQYLSTILPNWITGANSSSNSNSNNPNTTVFDTSSVVGSVQENNEGSGSNTDIVVTDLTLEEVVTSGTSAGSTESSSANQLPASAIITSYTTSTEPAELAIEESSTNIATNSQYNPSSNSEQNGGNVVDAESTPSYYLDPTNVNSAISGIGTSSGSISPNSQSSVPTNNVSSGAEVPSDVLLPVETTSINTDTAIDTIISNDVSVSSTPPSSLIGADVSVITDSVTVLNDNLGTGMELGASIDFGNNVSQEHTVIAPANGVETISVDIVTVGPSSDSVLSVNVPIDASSSDITSLGNNDSTIISGAEDIIPSETNLVNDNLSGGNNVSDIISNGTQENEFVDILSIDAPVNIASSDGPIPQNTPDLGEANVNAADSIPTFTEGSYTTQTLGNTVITVENTMNTDSSGTENSAPDSVNAVSTGIQGNEGADIISEDASINIASSDSAVPVSTENVGQNTPNVGAANVNVADIVPTFTEGSNIAQTLGETVIMAENTVNPDSFGPEISAPASVNVVSTGIQENEGVNNLSVDAPNNIVSTDSAFPVVSTEKVSQDTPDVGEANINAADIVPTYTEGSNITQALGDTVIAVDNAMNADSSSTDISLPGSVNAISIGTDVVGENTVSIMSSTDATINNFDSTSTTITQTSEDASNSSAITENTAVVSSGNNSSWTVSSNSTYNNGENTSNTNINSSQVGTATITESSSDNSESATDALITSPTSTDNNIADTTPAPIFTVNENLADTAPVDISVNNVLESVTTSEPMINTVSNATGYPLTTTISETAAEDTATGEGVISGAVQLETNKNEANSGNETTSPDGNNINYQDTVSGATTVNISDTSDGAILSSVSNDIIEATEISPIGTNNVTDVGTDNNINSIDTSSTNLPETVVTEISEVISLSTVGSIDDSVNEATVETVVLPTEPTSVLDSSIGTEPPVVISNPEIDITAVNITDLVLNGTDRSTVSNINVEPTDLPLNNTPVLDSNAIVASEVDVEIPSTSVSTGTEKQEEAKPLPVQDNTNGPTAFPEEAGSLLLEVTQQ